MVAFADKMKESIEEYSQFIENYKVGVENLAAMEEVALATTEKEAVYSDGKRTLYRYKALKKGKICAVPLLIVYAMVNRYTMMDIQEDRSLIRNLLNQGMDLYIVDWGYADRSDRYITMEDLIEGFLNDAVDFICQKHKLEKINLLGVCQGGTFSAIYTALHVDKIQNFISMVTPIDFESDEGLLNIWSKELDVDAMVDYYGNVPGSIMNQGFLMLQPFMLSIQKYINLVDSMADQKQLENFLRMETWIFDSPNQPGEVLRKFLKDLFQENKLAKGEFQLGNRYVDLKQINMPVMVIYAEQDTLIPPSSAKALVDLIGSKDIEQLSYPVGHIGMYVSGKTQKTLAPSIANWINARV